MVQVTLVEQASTTDADARWQVLAGLRFLLAMVVVAGHLNWFVLPSQPWVFLESLGGTAAVVGFLIISGYSIAHSLRRRPIGFYRRRVLRIYPLYVTAILFALVPYWSGADAFGVPHAAFPRPHFWVVVGNLLLLQNVVCLPIDSNMLVWTLGVEVICYLLAPLFQKLPTAILVVLIGLSAIAYGLFPRMGLGHYATLRFGLPLGLFMWAWLGGFVLQRSGSSMWAGLCVVALCAGLTVANSKFNSPLSVVTVSAAGLLVTFAGRMALPNWGARWASYLGDLSYPIYLFHLPTMIMGYGILNIRGPWMLVVMTFGVSMGVLFIESIARRVVGRGWNRDLIPTSV
jgi:peptidoglycan/LPS O-acetylase OafA/YrhL